MNAIDALAAQDIPEVERIQRVSLKPGDVLVLECEQAISTHTAERLTQQLEALWPGHKAIVLSDGLKLKVADAGVAVTTDQAQCLCRLLHQWADRGIERMVLCPVHGMQSSSEGKG